jgi:single-strand DNA-binding protein
MSINNNVILVGNLTSDPSMGDGDREVVNFRMAVNQRFRKPGEEEFSERTDFVDVECWGKQATNVASSLSKGKRAIVAGQLRLDQWQDSDGNWHRATRVKAHVVGPSLEFDTATV